MIYQQSYLNDMQTLMMIQKQGLLAAKKYFDEMHKDDQVNNKLKLESLLNKIQSQANVRSLDIADSHFDKK